MWSLVVGIETKGRLDGAGFLDMLLSILLDGTCEGFNEGFDNFSTVTLNLVC